MTTPTTVTMDLEGLASLVDLLRADGWTVLGPHVADGVVTHAPITSLADLPRSTTDDQQPAHYRLATRDDDALFGYAVGPQSWKPWLYPSRELLRRSTDTAGSLDGSEEVAAQQPALDAPRLALVGVRSCDLHAIAVHDAVLLGRHAVDVHYAARREQILVVAVTCSDPAGTCFCSSMGTGPDPDTGFDLALTEIDDDAGHRFLVRSGTDRGTALLERCPTRPALEADTAAAAVVVAQAVARMGRQLDTTDLRDLLYSNADHRRWEDVAQRCFACGNCTLVCPTCFCTTVDRLHVPRRRHQRAVAGVGLVLHRRVHPPRVRQRPRVHEVPLPPVGDAQAGRLVGPVRVVRLRRVRALHHLVPRGHRHHGGGRCHPRQRPAPTPSSPRSDMRGIDQLLTEHPFFVGLDDATLTLIAGCATNRGSHEDDFLYREGDDAETFFVIRHGRVALEAHQRAGGSLVVETVEDGEVLGWSWLVPPHRWMFDARAVTATSAVVFDGACLRALRPGPPARLCAAAARGAGHARPPAGGARPAARPLRGARCVQSLRARRCRALLRGRTVQPRRSSCAASRHPGHDDARARAARPPSLHLRSRRSSRCWAGWARARYPSRSAATRLPHCWSHTIRDVGGVTHALVDGPVGDALEVRGPYGTGWQVEDGRGGDVVLVAGGIGLAPLRPAVLSLLADRASYRRVVLLTARAAPADQLYPRELVAWRPQEIEVETIVDQGDEGWTGRVGLVTRLIPRLEVDPAPTLALVCGPETMMRYVTVASSTWA